MSQIYFIGDTSSKGCYYFHSAQLQGWVVADLDTGKCSLHSKLAIIVVEDTGESKDPVSELERRYGLGQEGDRWLVDGDDLVPWLRDHSKSTDVILIYNHDGTYAYCTKEIREGLETMAGFAKKVKKKYKE